ncbi:MAG: helix-turn-helix transcriptional regulator [Saprospiraceae bacterium]|nr:helix-turn-helix transcriptional regulator [Saprospiraceae bacterium]
MPGFDWISLFLVVNIFMGSLVCMLITYHFSNFKLANAMLLMYIGGMCIFITMIFFNYSGLILHFPWLYRAFSFVYYLIPPAAFLYVRTIANDDERLSKWDYLHFLPALLHFLELIPYHLQPLYVKQDIVSDAMADQTLIYAFKEGLLPPFWHHFMRALLGFAYGIAMFVKLNDLKRKLKPQVNFATPTLRWLFIFTVIVLVTSTVVVLGIFLKLFFDISVFQFYTLGVTIIFMISLYYMFFHPDILYGIPRIAVKSSNVLISNARPEVGYEMESNPFRANPEIAMETSVGISMDYKSDPAIAQKDFEYLKLYQSPLEDYLEQRQPYLNEGYSIRDMADDTGIPQHHLSALLNKIYGVRFNDFVNLYRIDYLDRKIKEGEFQNLSMDGIAQKAGFGSRSTLFNSIKKHKGVAPTDFFTLKKQAAH